VRLRKAVLLWLLEIDGLDSLSRDYGRQEQELVLMEVADLLRETFPGGDLIGRVEQRRFAVLAVDGMVGHDTLTNIQLRSMIRRKSDRGRIHLHTGMAVEPAQGSISFEVLWRVATQALCENKPSCDLSGLSRITVSPSLLTPHME
jgi:GGDEF domain-containing protein